MAKDYIPQSHKNLRDWLDLQLHNVGTHATALGMTPSEVAEFTAAINSVQPTVGSIVTLMEQLEQKTADLEPLLADATKTIRAFVKRAKTAPGCTPGIIEELQWAGDSSGFNPDTARPTIEVEAQRGRVKISGRKPGFEACNLYSRKKGDVQWKLIAVRKRKFPFYDETPLAVAGQPEVREYMAIGVIADEEVAQPSEIKEVVFAG
jgi:hypothetical protein